MDSIHEIKKYLKRFHKPDDTMNELEERKLEKSSDRVLTTLARNIRRNPKPPSGRCHGCSREADRILPMSLRVCRNCAVRFARMVDKPRFMRTDCLAGFNCDCCLGKTFVYYVINPYLCQKCTLKIGRRHRFDLKETNRVYDRF